MSKSENSLQIYNKTKILLQCVYNFTKCSVINDNESVSQSDYGINELLCLCALNYICIRMF